MLLLTAGFALHACSGIAAGLTTSSDPVFQLAKTEDLSFDGVSRIQIRISLPEHYSKDEIMTISRSVVADVTKNQDLNAVAILFFGPNTDTNGAWNIASVDWAPNGKWADADKVQSGDYSNFGYAISYKSPISTSTSLVRSRNKGLLGVPLPKNAKLTKRTPADPARGSDAKEDYSISGAADDIIAFFEKEMVGAGWIKTGPFIDNYLFFEKGKIKILVEVNPDGGSFRLMGS